MGQQLNHLQSTPDMPILKAVSLTLLHGYRILLRAQQFSKDPPEIHQGSVYRALYRLEHQGWIAREWAESENKRKTKRYRLTAVAKRKLQTEAAILNLIAEVIASVSPTPEEV